MEDYNSGQFITVDEALKSLQSREKDIAGVNKLHYKELSKDVFQMMNLSAIKQTRRILYTVDPKLHSITFPDEYFAFSTISGVNRNHKLEPLLMNTSLTDDLVDLSLDKNCESGCGCTDAICSYSKHYETITEDVQAIMPDETLQDFTKTIRKFINKDGSVYMEVTEPVAQYTNGTHTSTVLQTDKKFLCKLDVKPCGCIKDTDENREKWRHHGSSLAVSGPEDITVEWGKPDGDYFPKDCTYNISDDGLRIIFPSDFPYKKVLARIYVTNSTKNLLIPYVAKEAFLSGIKRLSTKYDRKATQADKNEWKNNYNSDMTLLRLILNRLTLKETFAYMFGDNNQRNIYYNNNIQHFDDYYYPY